MKLNKYILKVENMLDMKLKSYNPCPYYYQFTRDNADFDVIFHTDIDRYEFTHNSNVTQHSKSLYLTDLDYSKLSRCMYLLREMEIMDSLKYSLPFLRKQQSSFRRENMNVLLRNERNKLILDEETVDSLIKGIQKMLDLSDVIEEEKKK